MKKLRMKPTLKDETKEDVRNKEQKQRVECSLSNIKEDVARIGMQMAID